MKTKIIELGANKVRLTCYINEEKGVNDSPKPALLVFPGGAYYLTSETERDPVAYSFLNAGYNVYILDYSTTLTELMKVEPDLQPDFAKLKTVALIHESNYPVSVFPQPLIEAALAIKYIRDNAMTDNTDPNKVVTIGFSAGGNLAGLLASYWNKEWLNDKVGTTGTTLKPNAQILSYAYLDTKGFIDFAATLASPRKELYSAISKAMLGTSQPSSEQLESVSPLYLVHPEIPRTFMWHTKEDATVPVSQALAYAAKLHEFNIDWELHIYEKGAHGLSVASKATGFENKHVASWVDLAIDWLNY